MDFTDRYRSFFNVARHNSVEKARNYLTGLMVRADRKNMERMEEYVSDFNYQGQQQFISDSPWCHRKLMNQVAKDANRLICGKDAGLLLDESGFSKKGEKSAGVSRQYNGRLGKVDNCQVGVFASLSNGEQATMIDAQLFLPEVWAEDTHRCEMAKIPDTMQVHKTKPEIAFEMVERAIEANLDFGFISMDGLYGGNPELLRKIDHIGQTFVADCKNNQTFYLNNPEPSVPPAKSKRGRSPRKLKTPELRFDAKSYFCGLSAHEWKTIHLQHKSLGRVSVKAHCKGVWFWDGEELEANCWWLCCIDQGAGEYRYFISNAPSHSSWQSLCQKQSTRYWIERTFQDGKTSLGMGDYQTRGWLGWHHHMALVTLGMLFVLEQRMRNAVDYELLSYTDIVQLLDYYLPKKEVTEESIFADIAKRHRARKRHLEARRRINKRKIQT